MAVRPEPPNQLTKYERNLQLMTRWVPTTPSEFEHARASFCNMTEDRSLPLAPARQNIFQILSRPVTHHPSENEALFYATARHVDQGPVTDRSGLEMHLALGPLVRRFLGEHCGP